MNLDYEAEIPFLNDVTSFIKNIIESDISSCKDKKEITKMIKRTYMKILYVNYEKMYEEYREKMFNTWLQKQRSKSCVQSAGSESRWKVSLYFNNPKLIGFRDYEQVKIKQLALDCLNNDLTASKYGKFVKVVDIEKDMCSSTAFICSCI